MKEKSVCLSYKGAQLEKKMLNSNNSVIFMEQSQS